LVLDRTDPAVWARRAAARLAGALLRGGARPEVAKIGHPDVDLSGFWIRERPRGTRGSPGPRAERGDALGGGCRAGGVSTRRGSPACGNPALEKAHDRES